MTTADYNADNPFAVAVGRASGSKGDKTSYVLCHQPKSFDWRLRGAKPHPSGTLTMLCLFKHVNGLIKSFSWFKCPQFEYALEVAFVSQFNFMEYVSVAIEKVAHME